MCTKPCTLKCLKSFVSGGAAIYCACEGFCATGKGFLHKAVFKNYQK